MKVIKYVCNICHTAYKTDKLVIGIYLESSGFSEKTPSQTENHICRSCLSDLYEISKKYKEESKGGDTI